MASVGAPGRRAGCCAEGWLVAVASLLALATAASAAHKIQVSDPAAAATVQAQGGRLIADYGSFRLYAVDQASPAGGTENRDAYNRIELNAGALDTTLPAVQARRGPVGGFAGRRLHLVQFAGPVQPAWRAALLQTGVRIADYVPANTYLVYGDAAALARLQVWAASAAGVQWEAAYRPADKVHPRARDRDTAGQPRAIGTDLFAVQMLADPAANADTLQLIDGLKLAPVSRQTRVRDFLNVIVKLPPASLDAIAARPDVISVQPYFLPHKMCERQAQIVAGHLTGNVPSGPGYLAWLTSKGFTQAQFDASGFAVDVTDSGVDNGSTTPNHFGLYAAGVQPGTSRVVYNRLEGTPHAGSTLQGCDGHGNLNAHIIAGYDNGTNFPFADTNGYHYGLGICPFVRVGSSVIFDPNTFTYPDYSNLTAQAYQDGARISNNSWGADTSGGYDTDAQQYDALVRDAQPAGSAAPVAGNQELVIVFAAGNAGPATQTVGSPGTAKNVITVGAGENVQAFGGSDGSEISDSGADNANDIISFSSRGPCADGRKKPEVCAPGTHVSGGVAQDTSPSATGTALRCYDGSGVSGGIYPSHYFPDGQQFYTASSGTSHSTPGVAGACALLRQYFINQFTNPPSAAMTKAYLMNSARYMTGASANDTLWSNNQGMGEINLGMAFDGVPRLLRDQTAADLFTASGQARTFTGRIADTSQPCRVTLAWTDAPGSTAGNAYKNDLDLTVTVGGQTYKGNVFSGSASVTGGAADAQNNAESVFLPAGASGTVTITVTAANINSDGVPGNASPLDQDFALVAYNVTQSFAPELAAAGAALLAEGCTPTNGVIDPGETVAVSLVVTNAGATNTGQLVGTLLATNGVTAPGAAQTYGVLAAGAAAAQTFTFTATGACGGAVVATLSLQDGVTNYGTVAYPLPLGRTTSRLTEGFDAVPAPALPAGWTTASAGAQAPWASATASADTAPNAACASNATAAGVNALETPPIPVSSSAAVLTFRQQYQFAVSTTNSVLGFDGGVLEIKLGGGAYTDIITAGGSWVRGGYNATLSSDYGNPLGGRAAWSGNSGGFATTTVNLPPAAAGQSVQLRWRGGTGNPPPAQAAAPAAASSNALAYWSFDLATNLAETVAAGVTASPFTASNVTGALEYDAGNPVRAVSVSGFTTAAGPPATNYSCYAFALTVSNGYQVALTGLQFDDNSLGSGPTNYAVQLSRTPDFAAPIYDSGAQAAHASFSATPMNSLALGNAGLTGTLYVRIYGYASGRGTAWQLDNVELLGSVGPAGPGGWWLDEVTLAEPACCPGAVSPPAAVFSGSPTQGVAPLLVDFADASDGVISNRFWDFGDGGTTNVATNAVQHVYAAGTYTVQLLATGPGGLSTTARPKYIEALSPFAAWQILYFGSPTNPLAAADADADGTGQNNYFKYVAGLDPTNPASVFAWQIVHGAGLPVLAFRPWVSNRLYTVEYRTDLVQGLWQTLSNYAGPVTNGDQLLITDTNPPPPQKFYRLNITRP